MSGISGSIAAAAAYFHASLWAPPPRVLHLHLSGATDKIADSLTEEKGVVEKIFPMMKSYVCSTLKIDETLLRASGPVDIIHLAGHGETITVKGVPIAVARLQPKLVVLNACNSVSLARDICNQVPTIVVTSWRDDVASADCIDWTRQLYNQIKTPPSNWAVAAREAKSLRGQRAGGDLVVIDGGGVRCDCAMG